MSISSLDPVIASATNTLDSFPDVIRSLDNDTLENQEYFSNILENSSSSKCVDTSRDTSRIIDSLNEHNHDNSSIKFSLKTISLDNDQKTSSGTRRRNLRKKSSNAVVISESESGDDLDKDYVPVPEMSDDSSCSEDEKDLETSEKKEILQKVKSVKKSNAEISYELNNSSICELKVEFLKELHVPSSDEGGKHYKKQACCPYCPQTKLFWRSDRHMML